MTISVRRECLRNETHESGATLRLGGARRLNTRSQLVDPSELLELALVRKRSRSCRVRNLSNLVNVSSTQAGVTESHGPPK